MGWYDTLWESSLLRCSTSDSFPEQGHGDKPAISLSPYFVLVEFAAKAHVKAKPKYICETGMKPR
jgi:hypothetical protein